MDKRTARRFLEGLRELPEGFFYDLPTPTQKKLTEGWIALEEEVEHGGDN